MAKPKGKASTVLLTMTPEKFAEHLRGLKDLHQAADDAAMAVATGYKSLKKQGVNLDALRLVRKLVDQGNDAKTAAFLADFDRMRELAGLNRQLALFEEDKAQPQKDAEKGAAGNVVQHPASAKPPKAPKAPKAAKEPVSKKALFDEGDGDVAEISEEEKARQAGMAAGAAGEDYENPYESGNPLRDAWHSGYVSGSESASDPAEKASA